MSFSDMVGIMPLPKSRTSKAWVRSCIREVYQTLIFICSRNNDWFSSYNVQYGFPWLLMFQRVTGVKKNYSESNLCHLFCPNGSFKDWQKWAYFCFCEGRSTISFKGRAAFHLNILASIFKGEEICVKTYLWEILDLSSGLPIIPRVDTCCQLHLCEENTPMWVQVNDSRRKGAPVASFAFGRH